MMVQKFIMMLGRKSSGNKPIEPPIDFTFQWMGQSNSVSMMNAQDMVDAGITDLPTDDGFIDGWEFLYKPYPATTEIPAESGGIWQPSNLDMNISTDESFLGFGAQQRLAKNLLSKGNVLSIKSLQMSKSGSRVGPGDSWRPGSYMIDNNYGVVDLSQKTGLTYDVAYWIQGESDTVLPIDYLNYERDLTTLINYLRSRYPLTHFVIFKLGHDLTAFQREDGWEYVREAQENIAKNIPNCHIVRPDYEMGTKIENTPATRGHYDSLSQNRIGELLESYTLRKILNRPYTSELIIETTSTSSAWKLDKVANNGDILRWEVSGGVTISEQISNLPTLDLSGNSGTATIKIKSDSAFSGLSVLEFGALNLNKCIINYAEDLTEIKVIGNPNLTHLNVEGLSKLWKLDAKNNGLVYVDFSINPLLSFVDISNNNISVNINSENMLDKPINEIGKFSVENGTLNISNNSGVRSSLSDSSKNNLESRNWNIIE